MGKNLEEMECGNDGVRFITLIREIRLQEDPRERHYATVIQPWYVLKPGHRWPYALLSHGLMGLIPATREGARLPGLDYFGTDGGCAGSGSRESAVWGTHGRGP